MNLIPLAVRAKRAGITYVAQQTNKDCFTACVSMLTGIDLDLLPIAPPPIYGCKGICPRFYNDRELDAARHSIADTELAEICVGIENWIALLADCGFTLVIHNSQPPVPCIAIVHGGGHAVVQLPNGQYVDPTPTNSDWSNPLRLFVTVTPFKSWER